MRFSVLMPAYNVEKYIAEAIESIINQTFDDWELIIVDDGSPDTSGQIADGYAQEDPRIKVIHKPNGGVISARRVGITNARGEYCLFCDSDDFVKTTWMKEIDAALSELDEPDILLFNMSIISEPSRKVIPRWFPWDRKGRISIDDARWEFISSSNINELYKKAIKRKLLQTDPLDYSPNFSKGYADDRLLSLYPLDTCESIAVLPEALYYYRINDASMMHAKLKTERLLDYTHVDVQRVTYPYVLKWEKTLPGLSDEFFKQCYHKMASVYKKMILEADSKAEIREINSFNWETCLPVEIMAEFNKNKHLSKKDQILSHMALNPTMLGAYLLRLAYKLRKKRG